MLKAIRQWGNLYIFDTCLIETLSQINLELGFITFN
jgi:hypothetical protein